MRSISVRVRDRDRELRTGAEVIGIAKASLKAEVADLGLEINRSAFFKVREIFASQISYF